ncbi:CENPU [Branchiostoma lanceolatum]|uniref:Centromere protein U n=1 Tax=Branchiostoma lanceolatum TaxID=7740 RepID=A0A8K0EC94_BRALA|nr:CENPU [Branchiostoma lanceolatum]
MATSASQDAKRFTFWPDRDKPRLGLRPARGIAMRQTTIRPFTIVEDWSSPASSQHDDDDDDKPKPGRRVSSKVHQSSTVHDSPESVVQESPQHGSLPEQEEPTQMDIHASVPDAGSTHRRKSGRVSKARSDWWKASPETGSSADKLTQALTPPNGTHTQLDSRTTQQKKRGSDLSSTVHSESAKTTEKNKEQRQQSLQQDDSVSSSVRNTRKKRQQKQASFQHDESDSGPVRTTGKKKQQSSQLDESDSVSSRTTGKKKRQKLQNFQSDDSDSGSVRATKKGQQKQESFQPEESGSGSVRTTGKKKRQEQQSFQSEDSDTNTVRNTGKKRQQRQASFQQEESGSGSVRTTGKKKRQEQQSFQSEDSDSNTVSNTGKKRQHRQPSFQQDEPADSDSSSVGTARKKKRQRRPSFQPDESDSSTVKTTEKKKRHRKESSQALSSVSATGKRRQHSVEPEDSDSGSVRTTGKKKRQRRQSLLPDEKRQRFQPTDPESGSVITFGKKRQAQQSFQANDESVPSRATRKKKQQTRQSSEKARAEKTRPSSQRTPELENIEESNIPSESSMQKTRRVSKSPTEWWKVTEINGSDSRNGMSCSSGEDENQSVPQGLQSGQSSRSSSSSGGYRGMKTPRSQGQGGANNFVSGFTRRVISKRPPIPPQHAVTGNAAKGQTVYQCSSGGLERKLSDLSDLDITLTMIEDMTQEYMDASGQLMESAVCQEMMTQFRDKVTSAIQRKIDIVHKCKSDQSRLKKMDLTIRKRRSELLALQREDMRLDQQLDKLQEKLTDSNERELTLQKTCTVLKDLQDLQQKYMDSTQ